LLEAGAHEAVLGFGGLDDEPGDPLFCGAFEDGAYGLGFAGTGGSADERVAVEAVAVELEALGGAALLVEDCAYGEPVRRVLSRFWCEVEVWGGGEADAWDFFVWWLGERREELGGGERRRRARVLVVARGDFVGKAAEVEGGCG
jgi:hypothetical protein